MHTRGSSLHWLCNSFTQGEKWKQRPLRSMLPSSRRLSTNCNIVDALEDMLRDRLVCGLWDAVLQRRLLSEKDLTFQRAIDVCQAHEELLNLQRSPAPLTRYKVCQSGRRVSSVDALISQGIAHLRMLSVSHVVSEGTWQRFVRVS